MKKKNDYIKRWCDSHTSECLFRLDTLKKYFIIFYFINILDERENTPTEKKIDVRTIFLRLLKNYTTEGFKFAV